MGAQGMETTDEIFGSVVCQVVALASTDYFLVGECVAAFSSCDEGPFMASDAAPLWTPSAA